MCYKVYLQLLIISLTQSCENKRAKGQAPQSMTVGDKLCDSFSLNLNENT